MKIVSAIALLAGMAAAIPAFAQTPDPAANAVTGGTGGAATGAVSVSVQCRKKTPAHRGSGAGSNREMGGC